MRFLCALFLLFSTTIHAQSYVDDYTPVTFKNIADLMWKYNVHDVDDPEVYKAYFQTNKCDLFKKYYKDDFLWQSIIEGFKRDKRYFSKDIPNKFYITASIPIDRYDFNKSVFLIDPKSALDNAGSIQIPFYEGVNITCVDPIKGQYFPRNVKFLADRKFSLNEIPMNMDDANALLDRIKQYKYENVENNRILALRFLVTINNVHKYDDDTKLSQVVYKGSLDELAFFEDPQMTKLVWKKQFKVFEDEPPTP